MAPSLEATITEGDARLEVRVGKYEAALTAMQESADVSIYLHESTKGHGPARSATMHVEGDHVSVQASGQMDETLWQRVGMDLSGSSTQLIVRHRTGALVRLTAEEGSAVALARTSEKNAALMQADVKSGPLLAIMADDKTRGIWKGDDT